MNLNSAVTLSLSLLAATSAYAAPVPIEAPTATQQITAHREIVRVIIPGRNPESLDMMETGDDLREQVYLAVKAGGTGKINAYADDRDVKKHSSAVFKSVSIPPPEDLMASQSSQQTNRDPGSKPADPIDINSVEYALKNLAKSISVTVKPFLPGEGPEITQYETETEAIIAVTKESLPPKIKETETGIPEPLSTGTVIKPLASSFLYVMLCKIGLLPPAKIGLDDDCG